MIKSTVFAAALAALTLAAAPLEAQGRYGQGDRNRGFGDWVRDRIGGGRYGYNGPARDYGYRDGYEKGVEDARDRDRYDPYRHGRYRSANRGYDRDYGSRDAYRAVYRDAFEAGYANGYRAVRYNSDRARRNNRRW